jgi:CheY-like chemotaxis protein
MPKIVNLNTEGASSTLFAIATKKVLVIDDQKSARLIMEGVIRCIDPYIEVKPFSNPLEAIEWARANSPDLILSDY